ncbi:hypothetical protein EK21DRAFT_52767 [Setomelanomma holmii]|uniref:Uncharacterized protein n=1 Tax=Setomelanomma holmii TaxID=210430 RepID=A0A9P4LV05_9PLEO|nr:hypothetical protein EK21DRAFT_52767 [Setomelanomma holmii]
MSYANYDHFQPRPRHDSYYSSSRDTNAYTRHDQPTGAAREKPTAMRNNAGSSPYAYYNSYEPRTTALPHRSVAPPQYRQHSRKQTWPPSPSVEDETASLMREVRSSAASRIEDADPPVDTRGTVDQETLLEDIELPEDRRFVLVTDPSDGPSHTSNSVRDRRRRSVADRGNMAHINTAVEDPPVFTERVSTPYAYTMPQKEPAAPSTPRAEFLSPEPMTPKSASIPRSVPPRDSWDAQKDQTSKQSRPTPSHSRHNSFSKSSPAVKNDVFDDSDVEPEDTTHLRTSERKPARYSFVKSDLQKEDLRTNLYDSQPKPEARRRESNQRPPPAFRKGDSTGSSKNNSYAESPRSSSSSACTSRDGVLHKLSNAFPPQLASPTRAIAQASTPAT